MDSFLGALHGVLKALNDERSMDELWGLSGLGLRTQIHRSLSPAGLFVRQWDATYKKILRRFGFDTIIGLRDSFYTPKDLRELQFAWMDTVEKALSDGRPAISYGLHGPGFGIIRGIDNDTEEYQVSTFMDGKNDQPINVQDVGSQNPPLIFFLIPTGPIGDYDHTKAVADALADAVDHHLGMEKDEKGQRLETPPDLVEGPAAYNAWSAAIETGSVNPHWGIALYSAYYAEARSGGALWLRILAEMEYWSGWQSELRRVAEHLEHEVECFSQIPPLFPLSDPAALNSPLKRTEAAACLRAARAEHIAAMEMLAEMQPKAFPRV